MGETCFAKCLSVEYISAGLLSSLKWETKRSRNVVPFGTTTGIRVQNGSNSLFPPKFSREKGVQRRDLETKMRGGFVRETHRLYHQSTMSDCYEEWEYETEMIPREDDNLWPKTWSWWYEWQWKWFTLNLSLSLKLTYESVGRKMEVRFPSFTSIWLCSEGLTGGWNENKSEEEACEHLKWNSGTTAFMMRISFPTKKPQNHFLSFLSLCAHICCSLFHTQTHTYIPALFDRTSKTGAVHRVLYSFHRQTTYREQLLLLLVLHISSAGVSQS